MARQPIDYYVIDAINFDAEEFDQIVAHLNEAESEWRFRFETTVQPAEVKASLMRLVRDRLVMVHLFDEAQNDFIECGEGVWPPNPLESMYFDVTGRGQVVYLNWND